MKKLVKLILLITLFTLVGCGSSTNTKESNDNKITIAVRPYPYADITEQAKSKLKEEGIDLEVVVFDEANQANDALRDGSVDANYIQHKQYLDSIAEEKGYDFEAVANVHIEPIGFYSEKIKSIDLVEYNPNYDVDGKTLNVVIDLCKYIESEYNNY